MENKNHSNHLTQTDFELIEKYVLGKLEHPEYANFENRLTGDPLLSSQVKEVATMIRASREKAMRDKLEVFHQESFSDKTHLKTLNSSSFSFRRLLIAASIALLIVSGIWYSLNQKPNTQEIFAQFYEADPGLITTMSTSGSYEFNRGMVDYKMGKYDSAIGIWEALHKPHPNNDSLSYFLGSAYLAKEQPKKAIPFFMLVLAQKESPFYSETLWYLALAHVLNGSPDMARTFLEQSKHPKREELLSQLMNDP